MASCFFHHQFQLALSKKREARKRLTQAQGVLSTKAFIIFERYLKYAKNNIYSAQLDDKGSSLQTRVYICICMCTSAAGYMVK
jgi:hypothetical protein